MKNAAKLILNKLPKMKMVFVKLAGQEVLAGVPRDETVRSDPDAASEMNNATLAYIHENGAPASNIPARPFMRPGVEDVKDKISNEFKLAAESAVQGSEGEIDKRMNRAGLIAQSAMRAKINEGPPPPLKPGTIAARLNRGRTGTKPLIDTGQLRNSINYVIRKKS